MRWISKIRREVISLFAFDIYFAIIAISKETWWPMLPKRCRTMHGIHVKALRQHKSEMKIPIRED